MIAMAGENCVGICRYDAVYMRFVMHSIILCAELASFSDLRLGQQAQTVAMDFEKVFPVTDKLYIGLTGLASDVLSVNQRLNFKCNLYKLRENREIKPEAFSAMLSSLLYEKRCGLLL